MTDSGREVRFDPAEKPEVSNLMSIYTQCSDLTLKDVETRYEGQGYGAFKKDLAEVVVSALAPMQERYRAIRESGEIPAILRSGAEKAAAKAAPMVNEVKEKMGFLLP
ncbi:Tryptophan--tRNA ligase [compost metagenome]